MAKRNLPRTVRGIRDRIPGDKGARLLGRIGQGQGAVQVLNLDDLLQRLNLASGGKISGGGVKAKIGFGFFDSGLYLDHELLGAAAFGETVSFPSANNVASVTSQIEAAASAVFTMVSTDGSGIDVAVGTITFAAHSKTGVVAFSPSPFVLALGKPLRLFAPTVHDASLSDVTGLIYGDKA